MVYVEVTGWTNPPGPLEETPLQQVAEVLQAEHVGDLDNLVERLHHLPARVGPFRDFTEATSVNRLLMGFGANSMVVEEPSSERPE